MVIKYAEPNLLLNYFSIYPKPLVVTEALNGIRLDVDTSGTDESK